MSQPLFTRIDRLDEPPELTERPESEALAAVVREALRREGVFDAAAVDVDGLKPSTHRDGDTEGAWSAMDRNFGVLSGTVVIDWTDTDHLSGCVTVYVGSEGLWS